MMASALHPGPAPAGARPNDDEPEPGLARRPSFASFLDARSAETMRIALPAGILLYLLLAVAHPLLLPSPNAAILSGFAALTAAGCAVGSYYVWFGRSSKALNRALGLFVAGVALGNPLLHTALTGMPQETTSLALLLVAIGVIFKKRVEVYALLALPVPVWVWIAWSAGWAPDWTHFGFLLVMAEFLAVICFESLRKTYEAMFHGQGFLMDLAHSDPLTLLGNRWAFEQVLKSAFVRRATQRREFAVCLFDLDDFKEVNDTYGHPVGDIVLRNVAVRLYGACRPEDFAARIGGDEFVVYLDRIETAADARRIAQELGEALSAEMQANGISLSVGISVGVVWSGDGIGSAEQLMATVDAAMYHDKRSMRRPEALSESDGAGSPAGPRRDDS